MRNSAAAKNYFARTDYYSSCPGDWLGKGAAMLGLDGSSNQMHFWSLADNLHPQTGEPLTTYTRDGRRVGVDFTFNSAKSVGLARELAGPGNAGDLRVEQAHREAVAYTVGLIEKDMQARVRAGGENGNRVTGNLVAYRVTHRDTRINADDQMPDPSLHDHVFIFNATYDPVEKKWKAAEIGQIKHDAPYYEAVYHNRLAAGLKALGYGIERKGKGFEVAGITQDLRDKFSRRTAYIESVASKLGIKNPKAKAKLGATTRLGKAKELADDLNSYYASRLTAEEKQQLAELEGRPSREVSVDDAVRYAIGHMFERQSVVDEKRLYETAIRYGIGSVTPEGVQAEAKRQGLLVKDGQATTRDVLAEEQKILAFARDGRGTCRPMGIGGSRPDESKRLLGDPARSTGRPSQPVKPDLATPDTKAQAVSSNPSVSAALRHVDDILVVELSPEQAVMVNHVLTSPDRVMLVVGDAGTGKTHAVKDAFARIDRPIAIMAPGAEASRGVLREKEKFAGADTVTAFLNSPQRQQAVKNGVIWVDETGQLPIRDLSALVEVAKAQNARIVLQGDPKQHRAVARDGNMLRVLETHASLPVARLKDIRRQAGDYRKAVTALADGRLADGFDELSKLNWVETVTDNAPLVDAYVEAVETKKANQEITDRVLAVAPTHAEADEVTAAIRDRLKQKGIIGAEEHEVATLVPLHWTDAEKGDMERFEGTELIQWHRNGGTFKAGDRIEVGDFKKGMNLGKPSGFSVYRPGTVALAKGDRIRITSNGWTADKQHRLDNGSQYVVEGFEDDGRIRINHGWHIAPSFAHLTHGYVATSHASQGKTVDRVLIAMGSESLPAISSEQFYVSVSRGRQQATIFTDVDSAELRAAIHKADTRKSATELMQPSKERARIQLLLERSRDFYRRLRQRAAHDTQIEKVRKRTYER